MQCCACRINDLQQPPEQRFRNQPQVARAIGKLAIDLLAEDCGVGEFACLAVPATRVSKHMTA
jgi:hypothetical protein